MSGNSESVNTPISTAELERRWAAVRAAMAARKIDVLLMQNSNDFMGGYVKYFTDVPASNGYPITVVFPRDDLMSIVAQGDFGADQPVRAQGDGLYRGVKRRLGAPYFASAHYTVNYDAELTARALEPYASATIGLVGRGTISLANFVYLQGRFPKVQFVDASDMVDAIKVIKSEEELRLIRRTAALQDTAIAAALKAAVPGKREVEVAAVAEHVVLDGGGEQALLLTCSHPPGEPVYWNHRHTQARVLQPGDLFSILVESNGPGGFYTEISRTIVLGKASQEMKDEAAFLVEARKFTLARLRPGASCKMIWDEYNAFMRANDRPEERRIYCHGQGYDLVERPLVRLDEPMILAENMNLTCHPTYIRSGMLNTLCDNFLIGKDGVGERLHKTPEKLFELG